MLFCSPQTPIMENETKVKYVTVNNDKKKHLSSEVLYRNKNFDKPELQSRYMLATDETYCKKCTKPILKSKKQDDIPVKEKTMQTYNANFCSCSTRFNTPLFDVI